MKSPLFAPFGIILTGCAIAAVSCAGGAFAAPTYPAVVTRVVDGDTFHVSDAGRDITVRILGADTPERGQCWAKEATAFARTTLEGKHVRIVEDRSQADRDRYGRSLRYIVLPDGSNFSVLAARAGTARSYVFNRRPVAEHGAIEAAEREARAAKRGLWGAC